MKINKIINQWDDAASKYTEDQEQSEFVESNKQIVKNRLKKLIGK